MTKEVRQPDVLCEVIPFQRSQLKILKMDPRHILQQLYCILLRVSKSKYLTCVRLRDLYLAVRSSNYYAKIGDAGN